MVKFSSIGAITNTNHSTRRIVECLAVAMFAIGCQSASDETTPVSSAASAGLKSPPVVVHPQAKSRPSGNLPTFRMVGRESGFDFERYDDMRGLHRILEANGGGAALFDFDRDGWIDVFMTNGCRLPLKEDDHSTRSGFFRNQGKMQFQNVTDQSRLIQLGYTYGCAAGDYDNDGFDDLYVTAYGRTALWNNNGDGTFTDATGNTGTNVAKWSSSAAFADLNGDGFLDLYVVNYLEESDESPKLCVNAASPDGYEQCPPARFDGVDDVLFLSDGSGRFVDVTEPSGISGLRGKGLGVVVSDFDQDGRPEIFVANDGQTNFLFVHTAEQFDIPLDGGGASLTGFRYEDRALLSNVALSEAGYAQANMGIAAGDYDGNGTTDLFITHFYADTSTLYSNRGGLQFQDATRSSNLGPPSRTKLGWGTAFCDVDNDGWLDLIVANGHVDDRTWMKHGEPFKMHPQLFRNEGNRSFMEISAWSGNYFSSQWLGRGLATADLDGDGKLDAVVSHQLAPSYVLRNETLTGNSAVVLQLIGTSSNRNGYGARVELLDRTQNVVRELIGGGSFQSASASEIHLGLGLEQRASLCVYWPSGLVETQLNLEAGHWVVIEGQQFYRRVPDLGF